MPAVTRHHVIRMKSFWKSNFLTLILLAADVLAFCLIWRETWMIRNALNDRFANPINPLDNYLAALKALLVVWVGVMAHCEHYAHRGKISSLNQSGNIIRAGIGFLIGTAAVAFFIKGHDIGRSVILLAVVLMTLYVYVSRTLLRVIKEYFIARGHGLTRAVIIGAGKTGRQVAARIHNHPEVGYHLVGFIDHDPSLAGQVVDGSPVIGGTDNLVELLLRHQVEEVFLAIPSMAQDAKFNLITECEQARVQFKIVTSDLLRVIADRVKIDDIGDLNVILFSDGHLTPIDALFKRALDLVIACVLFILTFPLFALIVAWIRIDSPGRAIFAQERIGMDGRRFRFYKFRTMKSETDPYKTAPADASDPRITRFGRFLRKTSLDELPQFINVIKGDMSLVGPRPEMPFIVEKYHSWQRRRLDVPQGITGLWQIAGRKRLPLHQNLEYDFYYIRNWSLLLDLTILLRTIPAVLFGKGAF